MDDSLADTLRNVADRLDKLEAKSTEEKPGYPRHDQVHCPICKQSHTIYTLGNSQRYHCVACSAKWHMSTLIRQ